MIRSWLYSREGQKSTFQIPLKSDKPFSINEKGFKIYLNKKIIFNYVGRASIKKTRLLSSDPPPPSAPSAEKKISRLFYCFFKHIPIEPECSEMDYENTNLHYRKMLLTKYYSGHAEYFLHVWKVDFFSGRGVDTPPLIADTSAKKSSFLLMTGPLRKR